MGWIVRGRKRHRKKHAKQKFRVRLLMGDTIEDAVMLAEAVGPHPREVRRRAGWVNFQFPGMGVHLSEGVVYWIDIVLPGRGRGRKGLHLARQVDIGPGDPVRQVTVKMGKVR
jgi:hypothetical protein